jgi:hypothetical protein
MITIQCPCGEIYHAEEQHVGKNIKCSRCGEILSVKKLDSPLPVYRANEVPQENRESTSTVLQRERTTIERSWWKEHLYSIVGITSLICLLLFIIIQFSLPKDNKQLPPTDPPLSLQPPMVQKPFREPLKEYAPLPALPIKTSPPVDPINPKRLPHGSQPFGPGIRSGHSTITLDNGTKSDALACIIKFAGNGESMVRNSYIQQGKKWTAEKIPPGKYILRVGFGVDWNPKIKEFNIEKGFTGSKIFNITETTHVEEDDNGTIQRTRFSKIAITLHPVISGNFPSHKIGKQEFYKGLK